MMGAVTLHKNQVLVLELAHPFRHDEGREDVAEQVGNGADLRHEALDPQQQRQAGRRQDSQAGALHRSALISAADTCGIVVSRTSQFSRICTTTLIASSMRSRA